MAQQVRQRLQTTLNYNANGRATQDLARGLVYRELWLRLEGQPTVTGLNNLAANTLKGDEWAVVQNIEIIANGTDVIWSIDGNALWWLNLFMFGVPPRVTPALGDGATANPAFDSVLILPFWMPRAIRPLDTALDSSQLSSLDIRITWGDFTSINAAATAWTTDPTMEVYSLESFGVEVRGNSWRVFADQSEITSTTSRFQVDLPVGHMYRGFLVNTEDAGVDQSDILNNIRLVSGTTVFADVSCQDDVLMQVPMLRNGVVRGYSGAAYDDYRQGDDNDIDGWYWFDMVTDGFLSEAIDTLGFSELKLECDVTVGGGTTNLIVYPMEVVPVRG